MSKSLQVIIPPTQITFQIEKDEVEACFTDLDALSRIWEMLLKEAEQTPSGKLEISLEECISYDDEEDIVDENNEEFRCNVINAVGDRIYEIMKNKN